MRITTVITSFLLAEPFWIGVGRVAKASRMTDAKLTIYTGGHFGVVTNHAGEAPRGWEVLQFQDDF